MNETSSQVLLPPPAFAITPVAWSDVQLERLRGEWLTALRAFAYHPFVAISALRGDPPSQYRVDFRVRSMVIDDAEQLQYVDAVPVEIWIPPGYPSQAPLVRPLVSVFHPNVSYDAVQFAGNWQHTNTLADVIHRVGEYLAWRSFDPDAVVNELALEWMNDNAGLLPLDARGDFSTTAGGEPLGRINRFGPATLEQMRRSMAEFISALSGEATGPTVEQVRAFGHQTRVAMLVFLESDIPAELRSRAREFEQCALDLPTSVPSWEHVRRLKAWAKAVRAETADLKSAAAPLAGEIKKLSGLVTAKFETAAKASQLIPAATVLDPSLLRLPPVFTEAAKCFEKLRARLPGIDVTRPPNALKDDGAITKQLAQKLNEADEDVESARNTAKETTDALQPVLLRAKADVLALKLIGRWREYIDLFTKATLLEQKIAKMNSDAIDGYFIKSADGNFGPFQFEQEVDLGTITVVVSAGDGGAFEVRDAHEDTTLARGPNGKATAMIPAGENPPTAMAFRLAEAAEQPVLQLGYASTQTTTLLARLQSATASDAPSWCGRMATLFADVEAQQTARSMQRRSVHRWKALIEELTEISQFKARLATHFLITRAAGLVPRLIAEREALETASQQATKAIAAIAARSTRDEQTGQIIAAPKYGKAYTEHNAAVDAAGKGIRRIDSRLKALSNTLRDRLASPRKCGRPEVPALRKLRPLSAELTGLAPQMSDEALRATIAQLAELLKTPLIANFSPAPRPKTPIDPAGDPDPLAAAESPMASEEVNVAEVEETGVTANQDETRTTEPASEHEQPVDDDSALPLHESEFFEDVSQEHAGDSAESAFAADDEETSVEAENEEDRIEF